MRPLPFHFHINGAALSPVVLLVGFDFATHTKTRAPPTPPSPSCFHTIHLFHTATLSTVLKVLDAGLRRMIWLAHVLLRVALADGALPGSTRWMMRACWYGRLGLAFLLFSMQGTALSVQPGKVFCESVAGAGFLALPSTSSVSWLPFLATTFGSRLARKRIRGENAFEKTKHAVGGCQLAIADMLQPAMIELNKPAWQRRPGPRPPLSSS